MLIIKPILCGPPGRFGRAGNYPDLTNEDFYSYDVIWFWSNGVNVVAYYKVEAVGTRGSSSFCISISCSLYFSLCF
jgi:hypothetical protein